MISCVAMNTEPASTNMFDASRTCSSGTAAASKQDQQAAEECDQEGAVGTVREIEGGGGVRARKQSGGKQSAQHQHIQKLQSMRQQIAPEGMAQQSEL